MGKKVDILVTQEFYYYIIDLYHKQDVKTLRRSQAEYNMEIERIRNVIIEEIEQEKID